MAIEGSSHMCGSGLYELLVEREPGREEFSHENRWAGEKGGNHQAGKALLDVSFWLNELQTSGEAECQNAAYYVWLILFVLTGDEVPTFKGVLQGVLF